jgi:tRNA (cmo5U34)-methyltransferase
MDRGVDPVHTPKRRDVFQFDAEVATIFENMAVRSIPLYAETHRVHSHIVKEYLEGLHDLYGDSKPIPVADIGASTGVFIKSLASVYGLADTTQPIPGVEVVAVDPSPDMIHKLSLQMPWVGAINAGVEVLREVQEYFYVVNASYTLQFIPPEYQASALQTIAKSMHKGGMLLISQKEEQDSDNLSTAFTRQYMEFRKDNGYSYEEILNKTAALRNSMWPMKRDTLTTYLQDAGFHCIQETTRWLNFNSLVCFKG